MKKFKSLLMVISAMLLISVCFAFSVSAENSGWVKKSPEDTIEYNFNEATGVLVLCIGKATKLNEMLTSKSKEYIAEVTLGIETDTLDITGNVLKKENVNLDRKKLFEVINSFKKTYMQEVPIYSAVKVNGKKLYEYARNGEIVTLPKKEVTIEKIELLNIEENKFTFKCTVSKGTYIRSLIKDILSEMNIIGTMSELTRTKQGKFDIENTYTIDEIKNNLYSIISVKDALDVKTIKVNEKLKNKIINGQKLKKISDSDILYIDENDKPLAVYTPVNNEMKVKVMLYENC
mgnify:CR=1 FL=1